MKEELFSIVYCSRNRISGDAGTVRAELEKILASARRKNGQRGVTGALLYNAGSFAQLLEGSLQAVEPIFEAIQRDSRHTEVTVIQSGSVKERQFPEWSMAFVGERQDTLAPVATAAFEAVFSHAEHAGEDMLALMRQLITADEEWALVDVA